MGLGNLATGMSLLALGLNHRTAPVTIRERVAFAPERLPAALADLQRLEGVEEAAILSTCNRTELYLSGDIADGEPLIRWLGTYHRLEGNALEPYLYRYPDRNAVRHLFRVACGLDSMVLGEPQILGQLKSAYQDASRAGTLGVLLERLFQHTFAVAKQIRSDTEIGAHPVSVAFAAVGLAHQIFGELSRHTVLLIGAGETMELAARHLHEHGARRMIVANRNVDRARQLAARFGGYAIGLPDLPNHLEEADVVISSTGSQLPILGKGSVERAVKARKHRPVFMVDLAVPRDVEPEVDDLDDVYLYTVDDLREVVRDNMESRREAATQAEEIVDLQVARYMAWLRSLDAVDTIRACRARSEALRQEVLARARRRLAQGKPPEEVLEYLAYTLTNKFLHEPCVSLRRAGAEGHRELIEAARELFRLREDED